MTLSDSPKQTLEIEELNISGLLNGLRSSHEAASDAGRCAVLMSWTVVGEPFLQVMTVNCFSNERVRA